MRNPMLTLKAALPALAACALALPAAAQVPTKLGQAVKLDTAVNSTFEEIMPLLSPDRHTLYFVRSLSPANTGGKDAGQDVWFSTVDGAGKFAPAKNLGVPVNNDANNAICGISTDGGTIYLTNIYEKKKRMEPGISFSRRGVDGNWGVPQEVKIHDFIIQRGYLGAFMLPDEKTLLLTMKSEDAVGREDIYVSFKEADGVFSKPKQLGKTINTVGFEISPYYTPADSMLYFASNGHEGYGDADILRAKRLDDSWTKWSKPENMGPQVNSDGFDAYLAPLGFDSLAFFVKEDPETRYADIYSVKLDDPERNRTAQARAKEDSLASARKAKAERDRKKAKEGTDQDERTPEEIYNSLVKANRAKNKDFESILFDFAKAELRPEGKRILDKAVKFLKDNPRVGIELVGHTDSVGGDFGNQVLSDKRSYAAKEYLMKKGISRNRILNHGFGKQISVEVNVTDAGRQQNRRCELNLLMDQEQFDAFKEQYMKKEVNLPKGVEPTPGASIPPAAPAPTPSQTPTGGGAKKQPK